MTQQAIQQLSSDSGKTGGMWCALALTSVSGGLRYCGSKETVITSHQASAFTASRNAQNPEDTKAALD